jgi:hypothetical protein
MRDSIYLAAILTAAASALLLSAREGQAAMRWVIGRAILSYF